MRKKAHIFVLTLALTLSSCIGVSGDLVLQADGSGTLTLEYRIARALEALGRQDGNERWLPVPVGRADLDRTLKRLPRMKLLSFSSREDPEDLVISMKMAFPDMDTLLQFLSARDAPAPVDTASPAPDDPGRGRIYSQEGGKSRLLLPLTRTGAVQTPSLQDLFSRIAGGYQVKLAFSLPREGTLTLLDGQGNPQSLPGAEISPRGTRVSCAIPLQALLESPVGISIELVW
jgi:hypothetical protein